MKKIIWNSIPVVSLLAISYRVVHLVDKLGYLENLIEVIVFLLLVGFIVFISRLLDKTRVGRDIKKFLFIFIVLLKRTNRK